jgi:signal transduction histidine kinase
MILLLVGLWRIYRIRQKELALALQQQNFLLSITHELKSPLASIQLVLETIQKRQLTTEQLQKLSTSGLKENDRLHRLVQDLLLAARVEGGYEYVFEELNLNELLSETIIWARPKFAGEIDFKAEENLFLSKADKNTLSTAFSNLIENAIKYSGEDGKIAISAYRKKHQILVEIADTGPGIQKAEREKIFEKFYRIGNEHTRKTKGTGLGLYIVKKVIEAHGGTISLKDNQPKGTVFTVILGIE